jgi:predicted nucleic acid-binding protein
MTAYVDSGVLIKLYVSESNSPAAAHAVAAFPSIGLNPLQELEIRNTFRALEGRSVITPTQRAASEHTLEQDIILGRLRRIVPQWSGVFASAARLSQDFTAATLARSLDILHVALARVLKADVFITADTRQASVAERAGLQTRTLA